MEQELRYKDAVEAYKACMFPIGKARDFNTITDDDMHLTKMARSIVQKHGFTIDPSRIDARVVAKIPPHSISTSSVLGRCSFYGTETWDGSVVLVTRRVYNNENLLDGVLRHELAHALHASYDPTHREDDVNFRRLCKYLGGFVDWNDVEPYL